MSVSSWFRRRRSLALAALVLLGVVLAAGLAASWYIAGLAARETITLRSGPKKLELEVVAVTAAEITFRDRGDSNLRKPGIWGLEWRDGGGGWAQVGEILREDTPADEVTRALLPGWPPPPVGVRARLDVWAFPGDPSTIGLPFEEVTYDAPGGPTPAWYVPGTSTTWVIYAHGRGSERREALRILPTTSRLGLPALVISYRNDPEAPGPRTQYEFGATEWRDIEAAVEYATGHGATGVVLYGFSMGAVSELSFLNHSRHAEAVRALLMDSPMLDLRSMVQSGLGDAGIPSFAHSPVLWMMERRYGLDWDTIDYLRRNEGLRVPTLIMHGVEDDSVAIEQSDELAAQHPDLVELHRTEEAFHTGSWNVGPKAYEATVAAFLARILATP